MSLAERLSEIERAWAMAADDPRGAAAIGGESWQVLARAAVAIGGVEGLALLDAALAIPGAPAPLQAAHARAALATGDLEAARASYAGALLRARPDPALLLEAMAVMPDEARALAPLAGCLPTGDPAAVVARLRALPNDIAALVGAAMVRGGHRDGRLMAALDGLPLGLDAADRDAVALLALNHRMTAAPDAPALLAEARAREAGPDWVPLDRLDAVLRNAIEAGVPFSFVRLGDGEARFLMWRRPDLAPGVDGATLDRAADHIWRNWFGTPLRAADPALGDEIATGLDDAASGADLLGIASAPRLAEDTHHRGLCLALARYVAGLDGPRRLTEGLFTTSLEADDPHLARLLAGRGWLGMVSPHPGLVAKLAQRLGIPSHAEWIVPGESRLGALRAEPHLPDVYRRTLAALGAVPPGGVVLIAAGLAGKVYAHRVKQAGGIALDIGALADGWAGVNTRGAALDAATGRAL